MSEEVEILIENIKLLLQKNADINIFEDEETFEKIITLINKIHKVIKSEQIEISKEENYIINIEALLEIQDILINKINNNNIDIKIKNEFIFQYIKNIEIIKKYNKYE